MDRRRRPRTLHRHPGFHDGAKLSVDVAASRALLDGGKVRDVVQRLMVELVVQTGRRMITVGELKEMVLHAVSVAGSTKAAIKAVMSGKLSAETTGWSTVAPDVAPSHFRASNRLTRTGRKGPSLLDK
jgi:hypothetical protein